jgi:molybdate transport system regulatory protein
MMKQMAAAQPSTLRLRIRVFHGDEPALGPGRTEILARIAASGSIVQAAREMELSYMKAWKLIRSMNRCFREPLVELRRGGRDGGSARLTEMGGRVLAIYENMVAQAHGAALPFEAELAVLFAPAPLTKPSESAE